MGIFSKFLQDYIKDNALGSGVKCNMCGGEMVEDGDNEYWCPDCDNSAIKTAFGIRYNWNQDDEDEYSYTSIFSSNDDDE